MHCNQRTLAPCNGDPAQPKYIKKKKKKPTKKNHTSSRQKDPEHRAGTGWHGCWSQPVGPVWLSHLPGTGLVNHMKLVRLLHISFPLAKQG